MRRNFLNVGRIAVACHCIGGSFDPYSSDLDLHKFKG